MLILASLAVLIFLLIWHAAGKDRQRYRPPRPVRRALDVGSYPARVALGEETSKEHQPAKHRKPRRYRSSSTWRPPAPAYAPAEPEQQPCEVCGWYSADVAYRAELGERRCDACAAEPI